MNKKAFTLIELLAVIVILAIIAMIAVPIILNIINDTKKSSTERSKELYLDAVEQAIARKNLNENFNPSTCTVIENGNLSCDAGELEVEINGQVPKVGGTITLKDGEVIGSTLEFEGGVKEEPSRDSIGVAVTESNKTAEGNIPKGNYEPGDEYIINVDGTNKYHFYVLNTEGDKVSLIMNNNICEDGTIATSSRPCTVAWTSSEDYENAPSGNVPYADKNVKGPITVMNHLYKATKNWNNIPNIEMNYSSVNCYGGITTTGNETIITMSDGTKTASYKNLKARLLKSNEKYDSSYNIPTYILSGLVSSTDIEYNQDLYEKDLYGYWLLDDCLNPSAYRDFCHYAEYIINSESFTLIDVDMAAMGVRPVIEVLKSQLS